MLSTHIIGHKILRIKFTILNYESRSGNYGLVTLTSQYQTLELKSSEK